MNDKNIKILNLMKDLPQDMIDEYELCGTLPPEIETIDILCGKIFKCNCDVIGYTKNVILQIDNFYKNLNNLYK